MSSCTLLNTVTLLALLCGARNQKSFQIFVDPNGPWWEKKVVCCSLSWTTTSALRVSVLFVGQEAYAHDVGHGKMMFFWRLVDISDIVTTTTSPRQGDGSCFNSLCRLHIFRLLVNEPRSYNRVQGDDIRDSNPTFLCCLACAAILVRYNNRIWRRQEDQNERS